MGSWPWPQLIVLVAAFKGSFKVEDIVGGVTEAVAVIPLVRATTLLAFIFGVRRIHIRIRARDVTNAVSVPLTACFRAFVFTLVIRG